MYKKEKKNRGNKYLHMDFYMGTGDKGWVFAL